MKTATTSKHDSQITGTRSKEHAPYSWPLRVLAGLGLFTIAVLFVPIPVALAEQPSRTLLLTFLLHVPLFLALARFLGAITLTGRLAKTSHWAPFSSGSVTAGVAALVVGSHVILASGWGNTAAEAAHEDGLASELCSEV